jgi:hypothetical protein
VKRLAAQRAQDENRTETVFYSSCYPHLHLRLAGRRVGFVQDAGGGADTAVEFDGIVGFIQGNSIAVKVPTCRVRR